MGLGKKLLTDYTIDFSRVSLVSNVVGVRCNNPPAVSGVDGCVRDSALVLCLVDVPKIEASRSSTLQRDRK